MWSPIHPLFTCSKRVSLRESWCISLFDVPLLNKTQQLFLRQGCLAQSTLTGLLEHQIHQFAFAFSCCFLLIQIYLMKNKPNDWNCFSLSLGCFTTAYTRKRALRNQCLTVKYGHILSDWRSCSISPGKVLIMQKQPWRLEENYKNGFNACSKSPAKIYEPTSLFQSALSCQV